MVGRILNLVSSVGITFMMISAGGLSGDVAQKAMCEDTISQCLTKVAIEYPCKDTESTACRNKRYAAEKQCDFLYSHCIEGPAVKHIKPVFSGKKEH